MKPKFSLGRTLATPGALSALTEGGPSPAFFLDRHIQGDWGDICDEDKALNDSALVNGTRLLSAYTTLSGVRLYWLVTRSRLQMPPYVTWMGFSVVYSV